MLPLSGQLLNYESYLESLGLSVLGEFLGLLWRNFRSVGKRDTNSTLDKIILEGNKLWKSCVIEIEIICGLVNLIYFMRSNRA